MSGFAGTGQSVPGLGGIGAGGLGGLSGSGVISRAYIELIVNNSKAIAQMAATRRAVSENAAAMARTADAATKAQQSWATRTGNTLVTAGQRWTQSGLNMVKTGAMLTRRLTVPIGLVGAAATKTALDFDTAMQQVDALGGKAGFTMDALREKVLSLSKDTAIGPTELAHALYFVSSAGLAANQVFPVLAQSAKAAVAGMGEVASIGQFLTSVLNAYHDTGLNAAKATDILAEAIRQGKAEPAEFAQGMGYVLPAAQQLGISFDQVAAALANATNYGLPFNRAVTGLRYLLATMANPTDKAANTLKSYGVTVKQVQDGLLKPNGLPDVLQFLADKFDLSTVKGKAAWQTFIGGARGASVANTIIGKNLARTTELFGAVADAANKGSQSFEKAYRIMRRRPEFQFQKAWNDLRMALIELGTVLIPILTKTVIPTIAKLARGFSNLSPAVQGFIVKAGLLAALLGPASMLRGGLKMMLGLVVSLAGKLLLLGGAGTAAASGMEMVNAASMVGPGTMRAATSFAVGGGAQALEAGTFGGGSLLVGGEATAVSAGAGAGVSVLGLLSGIGAALAGVTLAAIALKHQTNEPSQMATGLVADLEKGKTTLDDLWNTYHKVSDETNLNPFGALQNLKTVSATKQAIADYNHDLENLIATTLTAKGAETQWGLAMRGTTAGSFAQREAFGRLLNVVSELGIKVNDSKRRTIESLASFGRYKDAARILSEAMRGQLAGAFKAYDGHLDTQAQKFINAKLKAHDYLGALKGIADFEKRASRQASAIEGAANRASGAGTGTVTDPSTGQQITTYESKLALPPGGAYTAQGYNQYTGLGRQPTVDAVSKVYFENLNRTVLQIANSNKLSVGQATTLATSTMHAATVKPLDPGLLKRIAKATETGKGLEPLLKELRAIRVQGSISGKQMQANTELAQAFINTSKAPPDIKAWWQDFIGGPSMRTSMHGQSTIDVASTINKALAHGIDLSPTSKRSLQIESLLMDGKTREAVDLLMRWIQNKKPKVGVDADTGPAQGKINALIRANANREITIKVNLGRQGLGLPPINPPGPIGGPPHGGGYIGADRHGWAHVMHSGGPVQRGSAPSHAQERRLAPDEVPAVLQVGEFVVKRRRARQPGVLKRLHQMNSEAEPQRFHLGGPVPFPQTDPIWGWDWPAVRRYMAGFGAGPISVYVPPSAAYVAPRLPEPRGRVLSPNTTEQFSYRPEGPESRWSNAEWNRYMGAGVAGPNWPDERYRATEQRKTNRAMHRSPDEAMKRWNLAAGMRVFRRTTDARQADVTVEMHPGESGPAVKVGTSTFRAAGLGAPSAYGAGERSRGSVQTYGYPYASVLTHELGHSIGLDHPPTRSTRPYADRRLIMSGSGGPIAPSEGARVRDLFVSSRPKPASPPSAATLRGAAAKGARERFHSGGQQLKSDEVLAVLQRGEFVTRREAVRKPGVLKVLRAINRLHTGGTAGEKPTTVPIDKQLAEALSSLRNMNPSDRRQSGLTNRVVTTFLRQLRTPGVSPLERVLRREVVTGVRDISTPKEAQGLKELIVSHQRTERGPRTGTRLGTRVRNILKSFITQNPSDAAQSGVTPLMAERMRSQLRTPGVSRTERVLRAQLVAGARRTSTPAEARGVRRALIHQEHRALRVGVPHPVRPSSGVGLLHEHHRAAGRQTDTGDLGRLMRAIETQGRGPAIIDLTVTLDSNRIVAATKRVEVLRGGRG